MSEWLGGFGIDEGMLPPLIAARDRWLRPGGVIIPHTVTAWTALVHDPYLAETVEFLRDDRYGLQLQDLVEKTVNEISYSGGFRHLSEDDRMSEAARLWTTDANLISLEQARAPHEAERPLAIATREPPTRSQSGSAPSSRPASHFPLGPATHRRTGG